MKRSSDHPFLFEPSEGAKDTSSASKDYGGNPGRSSGGGGGDQNVLIESVGPRRDSTGWKISSRRSSSVMACGPVEMAPEVEATSDSGSDAGRGRRSMLLFTKPKSRTSGLAQTSTGLSAQEHHASVSRGGGFSQSNSSGEW